MKLNWTIYLIELSWNEMRRGERRREEKRQCKINKMAQIPYSYSWLHRLLLCPLTCTTLPPTLPSHLHYTASYSALSPALHCLLLCPFTCTTSHRIASHVLKGEVGRVGAHSAQTTSLRRAHASKSRQAGQAGRSGNVLLVAAVR